MRQQKGQEPFALRGCDHQSRSCSLHCPAQALPSATALYPAGDGRSHLCHPASSVLLSWANPLGSLRLWCCWNPLSSAVTSNRDLLPERAGICSGALISDIHIFSSEKTLLLFFLSRKKIKKAAGKDLEHANNCTRLLGHISIFPRRSHGDDPIHRSPLLLFQSS